MDEQDEGFGGGSGGMGPRRRGGRGRFRRMEGRGRRWGGRSGRWGGTPGEPQGPAETPPWLQQLQGARGAAEDTVSDAMTARHLGSGDVAVLGTPVVVQLIERAAVAALEGKVPDGQTTVGVAVRVRHRAPTPVGAAVRAQATVEEVRGGRIQFSCEVSDPSGPVAEAMHARVVVDRQRFEADAANRGGTS